MQKVAQHRLCDRWNDISWASVFGARQCVLGVCMWIFFCRFIHLQFDAPFETIAHDREKTHTHAHKSAWHFSSIVAFLPKPWRQPCAPFNCIRTASFEPQNSTVSTKIIRLFIGIDKFAENGKNTSRMRLLTKQHRSIVTLVQSVARGRSNRSIPLFSRFNPFNSFVWNFFGVSLGNSKQFWVEKKGRIQFC